MKLSAIPYYLVIILALGATMASCSSSVRFSSEGRTTSKSFSATTGEAATKRSIPKSENSSYSEKLNNVQKKIISDAESWIGVPYSWGGNTRKGVDCSGFVKNIYQDVGVDLPRTANLQYKYSQKIDDKDRKTGDLVFFSKGSKISHVGIYISPNQIIHSSSGKGVNKQSLDNSYLQSIYVGAGRVLDK